MSQLRVFGISDYIDTRSSIKLAPLNNQLDQELILFIVFLVINVTYCNPLYSNSKLQPPLGSRAKNMLASNMNASQESGVEHPGRDRNIYIFE